MSTPRCERFLEALATEVASERPWSSSLEGHLAACEACRELAERWSRCISVLAALPSLEVPAELEAMTEGSLTAAGRESRALGAVAGLARREAPRGLKGSVVAALHDGHQQDRAVAEVRGLGALGAPSALDARFEALLGMLREEGLLGPVEAPEELEARVRGDLQDLPNTITRAAVQKLSRRSVPAELEGRVDDGVATPGTGIRRPRLLVGSGLAAAAALLLWAGVVGLPGTSEQPQGPSYSFAVEYSAGVEALSPMAQQLGAALVPELNAQLLDLPGVERVEIERAGDPLARPGSWTVGGGSSAFGGGQGGLNRQQTNTGTQNSSSGGQGGTGAPSAGGAGAPLVGFPRFGPEYFNRTLEAPFTVAFRGDRHVLTRSLEFDLMVQVEVLEDVASDGAGKFAVKPLQLISPAVGTEDLVSILDQHEAREGFFYRFRDFRIRDLNAFWSNYDVQHHVGQTVVVAGRTCERFDVLREDGTGLRYEVAVDPETSLVLEERAFDGLELVHHNWFSTLHLDPDLGSVPLNDGSSMWNVVDEPTLQGMLNEDLLIPSAPPTGYEPEQLAFALNVGGTGTTWVRSIYGDGLQQVFFLSEDTAASIGNGGYQASAGGHEGDSVRVFSFGRWSIVEGHVRARKVLAFGRVDQEELLLMLQSAVE